MDLGRLHRPVIPRPTDDQVLGRPVDLMYRVQVIVLQVHLIQLEDRHHVHFPAIQQLDPVSSGQGCINAALLVMPSDRFTVQVYCLLLRQVPDHEPAQPLDLVRLQRLHAAGIPLRVVGELEILDHIAGVQILQRIRPDQQRHVRVPLDVVDVVHVLVDDDLGGAQE